MNNDPAERAAWRRRDDFFTTSDGIRIGFSDNGKLDAPLTVLFLHGCTQNREVWDDVAGPLHTRGSQLRVVAVDHRGHGKSEPAPRGTAHTAQLACDIAEFIAAHIPVGPIVLVGHSMGGMTMMRLGMHQPDLVTHRVSGAVFVATSAGQLFKSRHAGGPLFTVLTAAALGALLQGWVLRRGFLMRPVLTKLAFGTDPLPCEVNRVWDQIRSGDPRTYREAANSLLHNDLYGGLKPYRGKPVAILAGARDQLIPVSDSRDLAKVLQTNALRICPDSGHMLPSERANEILNEIDAILHVPGATETANEAAH